jgi:hypothetical protein
MADTFTSNLVLTKPEVGASSDTWGNKLNANSDSIAGLFDAGPALKVSNGGTGATTAENARTNLGLSSFATATAILETEITDGTLLARVGGNETVTGNWTFSGGATFSGATSVPVATVTTHQASLSISEGQIPDGSLLARNAGNESVTGSWSFSTVPIKTGGGRFAHFISSTNTGGGIILSTSDPTGVPAAGDIWMKHAS